MNTWDEAERCFPHLALSFHCCTIYKAAQEIPGIVQHVWHFTDCLLKEIFLPFGWATILPDGIIKLLNTPSMVTPPLLELSYGSIGRNETTTYSM